jgi:cation diffusion facilitator CzcD-associated flavoprotein CzcO
VSVKHFDVLIVGAGLSGIGAAYHFQSKCRNKTYAILEGRAAIGGTWDLFRYPGIRSDSDMYTLGYIFKPWREARAIADGPSILSYLRQTASENRIDQHIRFNHVVKRASWSTPDACWTVEAECNEQVKRYTCHWLQLCSGYYKYKEGYMPDFPGRERFKGRFVHPQKWTPDIDYANKRVVVIGSGATAVTLVPELAKQAAQVTMLQRSPSYVASLPGIDRIANVMRAVLPTKLAYSLVRWKNVLFGMMIFKLSRSYPQLMKKFIMCRVRKELGNAQEVTTNFSPRYNPWDQRLCLVPDSDLFLAIKSGKAKVVTDTIETFTECGIRLKSGKELPADLIVSATGLVLEVLGGLQFSVDGHAIELARTFNYKGMMFSDLPNMAYTFGYTNASWTLKTDLTANYACRLLNHMDAIGVRQCTPRIRDASMPTIPFLDFSSGYIQRSMDRFPQQGARMPWKLHQNYVRDLMALRFGKVDDGAMEFSNPVTAQEAPRG